MSVDPNFLTPKLEIQNPYDGNDFTRATKMHLQCVSVTHAD